MPRTSKTDQELAYLRSAWEEIEEQAIEYGFITDIRITPTISRGVWAIYVSATSKEVDEKGVPLHFERAMFRYPNGQNIMFAGGLWQFLHRFTNQLAEARDVIARTGQ